MSNSSDYRQLVFMSTTIVNSREYSNAKNHDHFSPNQDVYLFCVCYVAYAVKEICMQEILKSKHELLPWMFPHAVHILWWSYWKSPKCCTCLVKETLCIKEFKWNFNLSLKMKSNHHIKYLWYVVHISWCKKFLFYLVVVVDCIVITYLYWLTQNVNLASIMHMCWPVYLACKRVNLNT